MNGAEVTAEQQALWETPTDRAAQQALDIVAAWSIGGGRWRCPSCLTTGSDQMAWTARMYHWPIQGGECWEVRTMRYHALSDARTGQLHGYRQATARLRGIAVRRRAARP